MGTRKIVTGVVSVAVVALLGLSIFRALTAGPADVPRQQDVENARRQAPPPGPGGDFRQPLGSTSGISGQGIVEPADREVKVGSRVAGLVQKIRVKEGDVVAEGAPLLELASDAERAAVSAAKADLDAAVARLAISSLTARRSEDLAREGAISRDERDRSVSQANIDRAGVDQAKSRLSEAAARLSQLSIKAPSVGTVLKLAVREGEFYSPESGALVTLGNLTKVRVRLDIDERFIGSVFVGQPGYVVVEAYNRKFPGKVVDIAQRMGRKNQRTDDPTERIDTKIREVVLELDDARELVPGLRATGYLSETNLESSSKVSKGQKGLLPPAVSGRAAASTSVPGEGDVGGWSERGAAASAQGNWREAVSSYEQAAKLAPSDTGVMAGLGIAYANTKQFDQAIPILEKALANDPRLSNRPAALIWLAGSHIELGRYMEGLERAQQAAALAPRDPQVPYWKARAYSGMGRFEDARKEARAALEMDRNHTGARAVLRALDDRAGGPPAVPAARQGGGGSLDASASVTTGARPQTAEEWDRRGAALLNSGKHREAVAVYREAVMAHPDLRPRIKALVGQYRDGNLELAYCLDPSDKTLAAAWAKAAGQRRGLCAESR
jgi:HlyD family secretion protein